MDIGTDRPRAEEVARLLAGLPDWFGMSEANAGYAEAAERLAAWTARDERGRLAGVLLVRHHFPTAAEVHLMAVRAESRGQGIGTALLDAAEGSLRADGVRLLQVKTLGPSSAHEPYAETRAFYQARGFEPLEELDLWGPDEPCLIMVKRLG